MVMASLEPMSRYRPSDWFAKKLRYKIQSCHACAKPGCGAARSTFSHRLRCSAGTCASRASTCSSEASQSLGVTRENAASCHESHGSCRTSRSAMVTKKLNLRRGALPETTGCTIT
eukprot:scaffold128894_cov118-Phaeocystis_antarctica.AAC.2